MLLSTAAGPRPDVPGREEVQASFLCFNELYDQSFVTCISGLVVEYIVAIDVTRDRFPVDAFAWAKHMQCQANAEGMQSSYLVHLVR